VILVGEADVRVSVGRVLAVLRGAGRAEDTVRRQQVVLDRFAAFLAGRSMDMASDRVCIDFIANQTGVIPEAAELVKAGFVVVVTVFLVVSGVFGACGTRSRGPGAAPAAQRGRTAWRLARMAQY